MRAVIKYIFIFSTRTVIALARGCSGRMARAIACDGQTMEDELELLARYAQGVPEGSAILEVGSFRGRSCVAMALNCGPNVSVYSVDPYWPTVGFTCDLRTYSARDLEICQLNLALSGALKKVRNIHLPSERASRAWSNETPLGFVFIDGSHLYDDVKRDFECWFPFVSSGGFIGFHDSTNPQWGVFPFIKELKSRRDVEFVEVVNSLSVVKKIPTP